MVADGANPDLRNLDPGVDPQLELRDELEAWLGVLTEPQREVFELRCFGDLSAREVAARLGIESNTVDQIYYRAKRRLREVAAMGEDVLDLLEGFAWRFAAGERPDAGEYLARAGEGAPRLAALLERFAASAVPPDPDEDQVAALRAWLGGEPPLLGLRRRRGLRPEAIVDALVRSLALDPAKRARLAGDAPDELRELEVVAVEAMAVEAEELVAEADRVCVDPDRPESPQPRREQRRPPAAPRQAAHTESRAGTS